MKRKSVSLLLPIRLSPVNFRYDWLCEWNQQKKLKRKRKPPVRVGPVKESYTQLINYRCEDNRFSCGFIILQKWKTEVLVLKKRDSMFIPRKVYETKSGECIFLWTLQMRWFSGVELCRQKGSLAYGNFVLYLRRSIIVDDLFYDKEIQYKISYSFTLTGCL